MDRKYGDKIHDWGRAIALGFEFSLLHCQIEMHLGLEELKNNRISEEEILAGSYLIAWINMEHTEGYVIGKGTHRRL